LGIAYAFACLGPALGSQTFTAEAGTANPLTITFAGRTILQPTIRSDGIVNAISGEVGRGLAPGSYISIYGAGLAETTRAATTPILPLSLANVSVSFDTESPRLSLPGRLHFVSPEQVNVQIPWELEGVNRVLVKVSQGWDFSTALYQLPLSALSPAVFDYREPPSGRPLALVLDERNRLVGTSNPARRGSIIQVYANGLGPVDVPQKSGEPAPSDRLVHTRTRPAVTIGGRTAGVEFSGLAPGYVGLYQVNVRIPADAPAGYQPLVISIGGVESKPAALPIE
jgi:minor extracellular serine protease Vpr